MQTPFFIIYERKLQKNIDEFKSALQKHWPNSEIAYSIKTNSLPWLLMFLKNNSVMAEAVSDEEYKLAKACGFADNRIVFNGPIKGNEQFVQAVKRGAVVNLDSKNDILLMKKHCLSKNETLGIRLNIATNAFSPTDIDYQDDGFRFGYSDKSGEFKSAIESITSICGNRVFGLHLHCNSITRAVEVYEALANYSVSVIKKYNLKPSFIDIGGGFFGGVEGKPSADEYISSIKNAFSNSIDFKTTKLIIEPGSAIVGSAIDLVTSVVDVKDTAQARIVTTDGSRIHIDPLWKKRQYLYSVNATKNKIFQGRQVICGYTCMDHDRIMSVEDSTELSVGDKITYHRVGAYSVTFGGPFIRYLPEVYVMHEMEHLDSENNKIELIRTKMNVEDYINIHSVKETI